MLTATVLRIIMGVQVQVLKFGTTRGYGTLVQCSTDSFWVRDEITKVEWCYDFNSISVVTLTETETGTTVRIHLNPW